MAWVSSAATTNSSVGGNTDVGAVGCNDVYRWSGTLMLLTGSDDNVSAEYGKYRGWDGGANGRNHERSAEWRRR